MTDPDDSAPPRPKACLRVGVTGHRPGAKLSPEKVAAVQAAVEQVLTEIARLARDCAAREAWAFASSPPVLSITSALAEGADRIVAHAGLAAGFGLSAILPFDRAEYCKDFETPEAVQDFDALLARAGAVFALDGKRDAADRAYEAAGLMMLSNADIVVAVWDQKPADGVGGTAAVVEQALAADVPVILIDPTAPDRPALLWRANVKLPTARESIESVRRNPLGVDLPDAIDILLSPPRETRERKSLEALYAERLKRWNIAISYPLMLFLLGVRQLRWSDLRTPPLPADTATRWRDYLLGHLNDEALRPIDTDTLYRGYNFIDHLSTRYAQVYRSAYVFNYIAGAAAVLLASIGLIYPYPDSALTFKAVMVTIEIGLIGSILVVLDRGTRLQWHRRWLEYRRLAETLRHLRMLAPTAMSSRLARPSERVGRSYDWVSWYARAVEREIPVPNVTVDDAYLAAVRDAVSEAELRSQVAWNQRNVVAMEKAGHRLHLAGTLLFWATLAICVSFLAIYFIDRELAENLRELTVFLTALFPAIGAALSAIRSQADFETVARRSHETAHGLDELDTAMRREPLEFARLTDRIEKAVDVLMADNAEWHVLFRTRPLSLPA